MDLGKLPRDILTQVSLLLERKLKVVNLGEESD